ncbi:MAG TPA: hypothetical protein DHV12_09650 [Thermotogae bacterium]|nr:hypothetical protein [Thermotogota bacterium]
MAGFKPIVIWGNWKLGWALSEYSKYQSRRYPDYRRTPVGEMIYQFKYMERFEFVEPLSRIVASFLGSKLQEGFEFHSVVPVPPSILSRKFQPVFEIASRVGRMTGLQIAFDYLYKVKNSDVCIKNLENSKRFEFIKNSMKVRDRRFEGKKVLLFDDIITTSATLREGVRALMEEGKVAEVYVLAIARTKNRTRTAKKGNLSSYTKAGR